ncbi:metal-dependent hydrolase [Halopelagius fulvigenes]|uniref:Metal-dependent hydrolase n=1 Tax=Halopelagius fulvigenes TaxID=1198324 RepID=A0ABD5U0T6_9EURY
MVDIIGHVGMALIWLAVGWFLYAERAALGFVALGVPFGLLPDTDLWLRRVFPTVHHHGITHTILFVSVAAVVIGAILARWVVPWLEERYVPAFEIGNRYAYAIGAVWVASLSHLFADMLSAPDIAQPIEPFWPVIRQAVTLDVFYYNSPLVNWGLFVAGLVLTAVLWWWDDKAHAVAEA